MVFIRMGNGRECIQFDVDRAIPAEGRQTGVQVDVRVPRLLRCKTNPADPGGDQRIQLSLREARKSRGTTVASRFALWNTWRE